MFSSPSMPADQVGAPSTLASLETRPREMTSQALTKPPGEHPFSPMGGTSREKAGARLAPDRLEKVLIRYWPSLLSTPKLAAQVPGRTFYPFRQCQ